MESLSLEEENIIKDIRNLFRLEKLIDLKILRYYISRTYRQNTFRY